MRRSDRYGDRGLTLIELVAAMAVFALVAVAGLTALSATLRQRDQLIRMEEQAAGISLGAALLRRDLSAMTPLMFRPPPGPAQSALHLSSGGRNLSFTISGQPDLTLPAGSADAVGAAGLQRVEWRWDPAQGQMSRRIWPVLAPVSPAQAAPDATYFEGVNAVRLRSYWPDIGWREGVVSGEAPVASATASDGDGILTAQVSAYSDSLPLAVEVTLGIDGFGPLVLLEVLK